MKEFTYGVISVTMFVIMLCAIFTCNDIKRIERSLRDLNTTIESKECK